MKYAIRRATAADAAAIGELTAEAYEANGYLENDREYIKELRDGAGRVAAATVLLAEVKGSPVASVALADPGSGWAEIASEGQCELRMLAVLPGYRNSGIATALTLAALDEARARGYAEVVLCSMTEMRDAHRIYERLGFTRLPEKDWQVDEVTLLAYHLPL